MTEPDAAHVIDVDLGETGDACLTDLDAEILAGLDQRLAAEARMDEIIGRDA